VGGGGAEEREDSMREAENFPGLGSYFFVVSAQTVGEK